MPWLIALRVVSLPATTSSRKNEPSSPAVSRCLPFSSSTSACISVVVMSSRGLSSRSSREREPVLEQLHARGHELFHRLHVLGVADAEDDVRELEDALACRSRGMPIMSQMICSGSAAAISLTKSHSPERRDAVDDLARLLAHRLLDLRDLARA